MKAEIWKLKCVESAMDMIHGHTIDVVELYIPELNISFNSKENLVYLCPNHHKELDFGLICLDD